MSTPAPRGRKAERYRKHLRRLAQWDAFLLAESGLPGPRANLELAQAVADLGHRALFRRYLSYGTARTPTNSPQEFLVLCGVIGYGRVLAEGQASALPALRKCAADPRWCVREGVALALQRAMAPRHAGSEAIAHGRRDTMDRRAGTPRPRSWEGHGLAR